VYNDERGTWDNSLKIHAATLWQGDFFSKKVLTPKGLRDIFVFVFLHAETRRVFVSPATFKTGDAWMREIVAQTTRGPRCAATPIVIAVPVLALLGLRIQFGDQVGQHRFHHRAIVRV
jgi:hypothetical protein